MSKKHISVTQLIRHIVQIASLLLFPGLFITVFSAVGDILTALIKDRFSIYALSAQLITVLTVFIITVLWGRFFCGFVCFFGTLQELIAFLSKKIFPKKRQFPSKFDHLLKLMKYFMLIFIIVGIWILALPVDSSFNPWGVFGMLVSGNLSAVTAAIPTVGFFILMAILICSIFIERFFCRYLCPLGAMFAIFSQKRVYKIRRQSDTCTNCGLCTKKCSMGIDIPEKDAVTSGECINCMQCVTVCPRGSLSAYPKGAVAGTTAATIIGGMVIVGNITSENISNLTVSESAFSESTVSESIVSDSAFTDDVSGKNQNGKYQDGVYTGTGKGFRGDTKVEVTVEHGEITEIKVLSYEDDSEFFNKAQSSIIREIISEQSLEVDTVSGATFSSNSLIEAVSEAVELAAETTEQEDTSMERSPEESETDGSQEQPIESSEELDKEASKSSGDNETENLDDQKDVNTTFDLSTVSDGTYEGSGTGFRGTTSVSVVVENGAITDITVNSYEDDSDFFTRAEGVVIREIIDAQSLEVDTVSGATFSSNSIIEAVSNALGKDFDNPNQALPDTNVPRQRRYRRRKRGR